MNQESKRSQNTSAKPKRRSVPTGNRRRNGSAWSSLKKIPGLSGSPFRVSKAWAMAGQEDVEFVKMRYETTSAFTLTAGATSYITVKGNSIYRPYGSNTDSPAGYQRLYTQYERSLVIGSRISARLWSNTSAGVQQPFRMISVPCTATQKAVYSAYSNISSLKGVPHASEVLFSPGATLPTLRSSGTLAQVLLGASTMDPTIEAIGGTSYSGESAVDPSTLWYHLIALQAMAGTTSLDSQIQVCIEFDVMFHRPIPTAVQSLNLWGNEEVKARAEEKKTVSLPLHDLTDDGFVMMKVPRSDVETPSGVQRSGLGGFSQIAQRR